MEYRSFEVRARGKRVDDAEEERSLRCLVFGVRGEGLGVRCFWVGALVFRVQGSGFRVQGGWGSLREEALPFDLDHALHAARHLSS